MFENASSPRAANAYQVKTSHETARLARRLKHAGLPQPFGNPLSGVMLVAESSTETVDAKMVDALHRSLVAVRLDEAYVTWSSRDLLEEILALEPAILVAVGPTAARAIDASGYPLARTGFSEAPEGSWFAWTRGSLGLRIPALTSALADADAKRRFWQAFLALRTLAHSKNPS